MQLMSIAQVAETLGVGKRTAWRLVARGVLPRPIRLGRRTVRWRADEVERALAELAEARGERPGRGHA